MLIGGSMYKGGLNNFFVNTVQDYALLAAMLGGFLSSGVITIIVSLCTHKIESQEDKQWEWAKTINIDNPLNPFRLVYEEELDEIQAGPFITAEIMDRIFRKAKIVAIVGSGISLVIFIVIIPSVALSIEELTLEQFRTWIRTFQYVCFVATVLVVFIPPFEEGIQILKKHRHNKQENVYYKSSTKL